MPTEQQQQLDQLRAAEVGVSGSWMDYWSQYSNMSTWQFWMNSLFLIVPLVVIWFVIDRRKAFLIGFYGLNIHVWFTYADLIGTRSGFWEYPYRIMPFTSMNMALDVSLVPVSYMLLYQWILHHNRNYYWYAAGLSAFLAFLFKPFMVVLSLFQMYNGVTFFTLFLLNLTIMLVSKWITDIFLYLQSRERAEGIYVDLRLPKRKKAR